MTTEITTWDVLDAAHVALRTVVAGVPVESWELPTPCSDWNVTQVLQHASGDQQGYAGVLTGRDLPTEDPFSPSGVITISPSELLEPTLAAASAAFAAVAPDADDVPVPLPQGPQPAWVAAGACALDAAVHAWDIAVATGQASPLDDRLADELKRVAVEIVEPLRGFAYAPALEGDATGAVGLLRYLGRDPGWTPAG